MAFEIKTRYGAKETFTDASRAPEVVEGLIEELETEEFDEPDDEHTQIAVSSGTWAVTAQVSGLLTLDDLSGITGSPPSLHLRAVSRSQVKVLLVAMAEGRVEEVRLAGWVPYDQLPPHQRDFFRKR